jgi:predicted nuclease of predicted toxin-antitoxin system
VIMHLVRERGCVLITADLDFPRLFAIAGVGGPGLILLRGGNYSEQETVKLIERVLLTILWPDLLRSLVVVDRTRVRKTALPL